jgi:hypothetical protein
MGFALNVNGGTSARSGLYRSPYNGAMRGLVARTHKGMNALSKCRGCIEVQSLVKECTTREDRVQGLVKYCTI